jgi:hypothetical protein
MVTRKGLKGDTIRDYIRGTLPLPAEVGIGGPSHLMFTGEEERGVGDPRRIWITGGALGAGGMKSINPLHLMTTSIGTTTRPSIIKVRNILYGGLLLLLEALQNVN